MNPSKHVEGKKFHVSKLFGIAYLHESMRLSSMRVLPHCSSGYASCVHKYGVSSQQCLHL